MNGRQRNATNAQIWGSKTTRIMMATVPHVTFGSGLRKFQADGFLFDRVYKRTRPTVRGRILATLTRPEWRLHRFCIKPASWATYNTVVSREPSPQNERCQRTSRLKTVPRSQISTAAMFLNPPALYVSFPPCLLPTRVTVTFIAPDPFRADTRGIHTAKASNSTPLRTESERSNKGHGDIIQASVSPLT